MTDGKWWHPARHRDRRPFLLKRGQVRRALSDWFVREGFLEVECAALQVSPGNETHLHAFETEFRTDDGQVSPLYLHTSPEFSCKKLLAAGEEKIVDFSRVFRNREQGLLHSPEFTMVEWYRTGADLAAVMQDAVDLCRAALNAMGETALRWKGRTCDPGVTPEYLTLTEAFHRHAKTDLNGLLDDRDGFLDAARRAGVGVPDDASWSDIFSAVLVTLIEPALGDDRLTVLHRYPVCEAALARACPDDPRFAERFELYACGVELANGFHELTDAGEQRARFEADMALKQEIYGERYPIDEDFLEALGHMPDASGVALGFDRLVMLASGARSIRDVQWTPVET
ncbi:EF-P lysine aminoacylase EpmA [Hyphomonas sp.]|uniref:EF-P lysine aminoacylase EpmA n=1 Tax=Hyphomonas sp. TaxID=87 RepID=UPI000C691E30|nr:EF-P lysine aminoacylase EpmA [Hyphomonas sp.]MAB12025.1 EF-P lysine aminoacylase GenX [Hyphomonas sp.]MAU67074.1 EF-P lysine aminoacylase GenX [Hyphomonas sp.]MBM57180.1 EF-P lysine aminoacylase GenX [Hyphomonas sp.]